MVGLCELENMQLAQQLIRARLRLSVIRALTDVSTLTLRQWWHDIHGVRPANGKLPETVLSFIKDVEMAARLSHLQFSTSASMGQLLRRAGC